MKKTPKAKLSYFDPLWMLTEDDGSLMPKSSLFMPENHAQLALEDFLQHRAVFIGPGGRTAHCDSYNTIVDFGALDKAMAVLEEQYHPTKEDWLPAVNHWFHGINMQPPLRLVAIMIATKFGIELVDACVVATI